MKPDEPIEELIRPNTFAWFEARHHAHLRALAAMSAYCGALHARVTSPLPLSVQDAIARKALR